jgi:hypothetical protein
LITPKGDSKILNRFRVLKETHRAVLQLRPQPSASQAPH